MAADVLRRVQDQLAQTNDAGEVAGYRVLKQEDLHALVVGSHEDNSIELDVELMDWGYVEAPLEAYYGQIPSDQVATWWNQWGPDLFRKNLRELIPDSDVNAAISRTLQQDPERFWYFNNGITVLCTEIKKKLRGAQDRRIGGFVVRGASVVNGAQTVGAIGRAYASDPKTVTRARAFVRFIALGDESEQVANAITSATNTQNRIQRRDFVALDPEQRRLSRDMRIDLGKDYAIKTGEPEPAPTDGCSVTEATVALACAQPDPILSVLAKREISRLWEDLSGPPYRTLFNPTRTSFELWRCVLIMRAVETALKSVREGLGRREHLISVHGNRLLLHLVFQVLDTSRFADPEFDLGSVISRVDATVHEMVARLIALVLADYPTSYPAALFKNREKCKSIASSALRSDVVQYANSAGQGELPLT